MEHHAHPATKPSWQDYLPLIVITGYCILLGFVHKESFMYGFMGYFLVFLSMFKFFDLKGFAEAFASYDLVTQKFPPYAYIYPGLELILGVAYIGNILPKFINIITILVMAAAAAGVIKSVMSKQKISCACLGTVLKVPLSTVSIIENVGMAVMAFLMLIF